MNLNDPKELVLEVVSCRRSVKSGGNLVLDLNMGNPMTNPPKSTKITRDLFDIRFKNKTDGNIYTCETTKFYRVGDLQMARQASILERLSSTYKMKNEDSGKTTHLIFI